MVRREGSSAGPRDEHRRAARRPAKHAKTRFPLAANLMGRTLTPLLQAVSTCASTHIVSSSSKLSLAHQLA